MATNRESPLDYQYATDAEGTPLNRMVQIDMAGLSEDFLQWAAVAPVHEVQAKLRVGAIFEIENSVAMYGFLRNIHGRNGQQSTFDTGFTSSLEAIRNEFNRPIALLATTADKYSAMKASEFGKRPADPLYESEVQAISGFDAFLGPEEFERHLARNNGQSDYLLYVRSSLPVAKLRNPSIPLEGSILANTDYRQTIKANSLTMNIDSPEWDIRDHRKINDTKAWMPAVGMAYGISSVEDLQAPDFANFLTERGIKNDLQEANLRYKPALDSYGCYGHISGTLNSKVRASLRKALRTRGDYVVQPELPQQEVINEYDGTSYTYIDRNFMGMANGQPFFISGFRSFMPSDSDEARAGRNHGSRQTVFGEIRGENNEK